jgi:sarcosine oxidase subunit alpha
MSARGTTMRLGPQAGEVIDREAELTFSWNGDTFRAFAGDTIVSALAAAGERVFSRSLKYHRPRGLLTGSFHDPGCMMQVGDEPNVRGAHRLASQDMVVRSQNTWPSLRFDAKAVNRYAGPFLGAGFYYKTFMRPRALWPAYESVLRRFVNAGSVSPATAACRTDKRHAHPDVLVAGGGPAGMAAALSAARSGASVLLVEEEHQLGGHLRWGGAAELTVLADLAAQVAAEPRIEVLTNSVALGRYDGNLIAVLDRGAGAREQLGAAAERLIKARAKSLVVAAGLIERPYVFAGNDLPGVMLSTAARRLINLYAVQPGRRAVVLTANADGDAAIVDLRRAGVEVVSVQDARAGGDIAAVHGRTSVRSVELADGTKVSCDLLVTAVGWTAPTSLLNMAGSRPAYDPSAARFLPDLADLPHDVLATGGIVGDGSLDELTAHGTAVGAEAARRAAVSRAWQGIPGRMSRPRPAAAAPAEATPIPALRAGAHPEIFAARTNGFVDFSEDVTAKDLEAAVGEGYHSAELVKRYTTATMGPLQGKLETVNSVAVVAAATGRSIAETGTTTWRPPYAPVTLAALAGQLLEPVRVSPMQPWHEAHGAVPLQAGAWIRPDHYGNAAAEARNVRQNVGIIDVTPIGKLDLRGPDVPQLLNLLYVNKWSRLEIGRVRYGVMCAEDGVVLDDGVTGRLGVDHYLMSTTSSGAAAIWEWVENWLQTEHPDWLVHVTPVTTAYASINVAGPRSRQLLERVTAGVDLSNGEFGYMNVRTGQIAGVDDCVLWRIGFTGELSFELHVPAGYGLHVWEALLEHGKDLRIAPFGVEAQRILRLEKGHLIVGQDTDGLTKAYGAALDWAIKLDKEDFAGKPELSWQLADGVRSVLVGLQPVDGSVVPAEASQIVDAGAIVGRVTSSRMSPTLNRSVCLAVVDERFGQPGSEVTVLLPSGRRILAWVMPALAHVDPDGARMRV